MNSVNILLHWLIEGWHDTTYFIRLWSSQKSSISKGLPQKLWRLLKWIFIFVSQTPFLMLYIQVPIVFKNKIKNIFFHTGNHSHSKKRGTFTK